MCDILRLISNTDIDSESEKEITKKSMKQFLMKALDDPQFNLERCILFLQKYQNHSKKNSKKTFEIHILLGKNNEYIDCSINNKEGGELTEKMRHYIEKNNSHLIHNHPSNGSLSTSDWKTLSAHLRLQMTAVNDFGSYFTGSVTRALNDNDHKIFICKLNHLGEIKNKLTSEYCDFTTSSLQNGFLYDIENHITNIDTWLNHKLGLVLLNAGFSTYTHEIKIGDNAAADKINCLNNLKFQATINLINNW